MISYIVTRPDGSRLGRIEKFAGNVPAKRWVAIAQTGAQSGHRSRAAARAWLEAEDAADGSHMVGGLGSGTFAALTIEGCRIMMEGPGALALAQRIRSADRGGRLF